MQSLFNKKKRKTAHESPEGVARSSKHSKSNGNDYSRPSYPSETRSFDISYKSPVPNVATRAEKIANLFHSLEEVLEEDGMDETLSLVGEETLSRCVDLRTSLSRSKPLVESLDRPPTIKPKSSQTSMSYDFQNIPKLMSPLSITPWKSSTIPHSLPPLPEILDPTLAAATFIHASCGGGKMTDLNYERLEWVGDAYLELIATLLIAQTFPLLNPGKASQFREGLVKNVTLAEYAKRYGFDKRIRLPELMLNPGPSKIKEQDLIKVYGDVFEAYVAAVILSDPVDGVQRAAEWLKDLWGQTMQGNIIHEERTNFKFDSPLWRLRGDVGPVKEIAIADKTQVAPLSSKELLQKSIGAKGIRIRYEDVGKPKKDPDNKLAVFTVAVYLDGWGEKGKLLGTGKGNGKKEAGDRAAGMALQNKKLMDGFMQKKKLADAQAELEKQALEQHDPV